MLVLAAIHIGNELNELRTEALKTGEDMGIKCPLSVLPMHISLKKGFEIDEGLFDDCVSTICGIYSRTEPFPIEFEGLEMSDGLIWLRIRENRHLRELHSELVETGKAIFGIEPNEIDLDFKFHSTVFMDSRADLGPAFDRISKVSLPERIMVRDFIIGTDVSGQPDSYAVYSKSCLKPFVSIREQWKRFELG